jgi:hypothetical protein
METNNGNLAVCADLLDASGNKIVTGTCNGVSGPFTIPATGSSTLVVHDASYSTAGNYNLNLQFPSGRCASGTACGQTKSGTLAAAQQDAYSFSANAGEVVTFPSMETNNGNLAVCTDLYASGKKIANNPCNGANAPFTLPTTGQYVFVVHAAGYFQGGNYNLNLQFPTGRCATGTTCGQTKSGTLAAAKQDAYSFSGNAGEVVTFPSMETNNGNLAACTDLYASGTKLASNPCNGVNVPFTLPTTGQYVFVVHAAGYFQGGNYNLNLQFPSGRCATGTACGQTKSGTLAAAQQDAYSFSGNAGEVVIFPSMETNNGNLAACTDLYASGKNIASNPCNGVNAPFTLPTTGQYVFVVHAGGYFQGGNYNLNLQFPTGRCATGTACGQTKSGTLAAAKQDAYSFSGNAGEVVTFPSMETNNGNLAACTDLYASGKKIASNPCNGVNVPFTLPTTGQYIFVVHAGGYFQGGNYNLNLQFPTGRCAIGTACGQTKSGTLAAAQQDAYSFSAIGGQVVTFASVETNNGNLAACADLYASGKKIASDPCNGVSAPVTLRTTGKYIFVVHDGGYFQSGNYNANWQFITGCPICSVSPTSLTFPTQLRGTTSAAKTVTATNTGNATMSITSIGITGTNSGDFTQTQTCGTSLAVGAKCTISVRFAPAARGARTADVVIADNAAPPNPQTVALAGTGTIVKLVPTSLSFGAQLLGTTSAVKAVTITNVGTATLNFSSISLTGPNAGDFTITNTCGSALGAAASCTISVTFHPSAIGPRSATVSIRDDGGGSPQLVSLSGTGTAVKLVPTSVSFGNQKVGTTSAAKVVTMTNVGTTTLSISGISLTGTNAGDFSQTNTCGSTLAAGASCTISVTFHPLVTGVRSAVLSIGDNGGGSPQLVPLSGTGT